MNENHKEWFSIGLTIVIVALALFIAHRFIPSLIWASIIAISTFPLYRRWRHLFLKMDNLSSFLFTTLIALVIVAPLSWVATILVQESQLFINYLQVINREGSNPPEFIHHLPWIGPEIESYWNNNISQPGSVKHVITDLRVSLTSASYYVKQVGANIVHRGVQLGFTLLCLFFFYRDGNVLSKQIHKIGERCLGHRWFRYANQLPSALRATVNGTIVVGMGVGLLMGACYAFVHFPAPTLLGIITAIAAMIPFVVPVVFLGVAFVLLANAQPLDAALVIVWGTIVMFIADHFVKPVLIGGATRLPFLAVLFGILGGIETLGVLGLFIGPVIMVLFITLWDESQEHPEAKLR